MGLTSDQPVQLLRRLYAALHGKILGAVGQEPDGPRNAIYQTIP